MFVCHCKGFHGYHTHTHTGGQRGEATSVSVEKDEWESHTSEKEKRHIKFGAVHPSSEGFNFQQYRKRVQQCSVLLIFVFCEDFTVKCFNSNNPRKCLYKAEK